MPLFEIPDSFTNWPPNLDDPTGSPRAMHPSADANSIRTVTADYTATNTDVHIIIDATANTVTVTLPAAPSTNLELNIACLNSTYTADIDLNGKNFYTTSANQSLIAGENLRLLYDGTRWIGI